MCSSHPIKRAFRPASVWRSGAVQAHGDERVAAAGARSLLMQQLLSLQVKTRRKIARNSGSMSKPANEAASCRSRPLTFETQPPAGGATVRPTPPRGRILSSADSK